MSINLLFINCAFFGTIRWDSRLVCYNDWIMWVNEYQLLLPSVDLVSVNALIYSASPRFWISLENFCHPQYNKTFKALGPIHTERKRWRLRMGMGMGPIPRVNASVNADADADGTHVSVVGAGSVCPGEVSARGVWQTPPCGQNDRHV